MISKRKRGELGQGLVEFAVIFPLFMFLLFGVLDIGLAMNRRATVQHAVREGARFAATSDQPNWAVIDRTENQLMGWKPEDMTICVEYNEIPGGDDDTAVDVKILYDYEPFILNVGLGLFGAPPVNVPWEVTGSARMEADETGAEGCETF